MKWKTIYLTYAGCLIFANSLWAQNLSGLVIDGRTKEVLPGANVYLIRDLAIGTTTSLDGRFSIPLTSVRPSDTLRISFVGYKDSYLIVSNAKGKGVTIRMESSSQKIDEVVVRAERLIAEEFNYKKISKIEVYKNPSAKADPLLAVNSMPSATTTDESANVSFRGSSPGETGIFFNDVPIYGAVRFAGLNGIGTFSIFNTSIIKDLLVFPGNPPLEYGNTTSGVISLYSDDRIPGESQNSAIVSLASYGFNRYQRLGKNSALTFFTNYSLSGIIRSLNGEALRDVLKFRANDIGIHFVHQFDQKTNLRFFNYAISEGYQFQLREPTFTGVFEQQKKRNFSVVNLKRSYANSSLTFNGGFSVSQSAFDYSRTYIEIKNQDYFIGVNYSYFGRSDELKFGISYDNREQQFRGDVPEFDFAVGIDHPVIDIRATDDVATPEFYSYYKRQISEKWTIGAGVRKNIALEDQQSYWSYQSNFHFQPTKNFKIIIGAGQYHQYQFGRDDNGELLRRSRQFSTDFKYKRPRSEQAISVFYKKNRATISTEIRGLEYYTSFKFNATTKAQISLTAISAKHNNGELEYSSPFDIGLFAKGSLTKEFPYGISVTSNFLWRQGTFFLPIENSEFRAELNAFEPIFTSLDDQQRLDSYRIVDLAISKMHPISEKLVIIYFASLNNVFDFKNQRSLTYNFDYTETSENYFSRRSVYFGASLNF